MVNWKTTLGGLLAAIGAFLQTIEEPSWLGFVGTIILALGTFLTGSFARDYNKTSEESGVR